MLSAAADAASGGAVAASALFDVAPDQYVVVAEPPPPKLPVGPSAGIQTTLRTSTASAFWTPQDRVCLKETLERCNKAGGCTMPEYCKFWGVAERIQQRTGPTVSHCHSDLYATRHGRPRGDTAHPIHVPSSSARTPLVYSFTVQSVSFLACGVSGSQLLVWFRCRAGAGASGACRVGSTRESCRSWPIPRQSRCYSRQLWTARCCP